MHSEASTTSSLTCRGLTNAPTDGSYCIARIGIRYIDALLQQYPKRIRSFIYNKPPKESA